MTVAEAEAFVSEATARMSSDSPSHGVAASFLEDAVQMYRTVPRDQRDRHDVDQRIQELRLRLNEHGERAQEEMVTVRGDEIMVKESLRLERHFIRGLRKIALHCLMSVLAFQLTAITRLRLGQPELLRWMVRPVA